MKTYIFSLCCGRPKAAPTIVCAHTQINNRLDFFSILRYNLIIYQNGSKINMKIKAEEYINPAGESCVILRGQNAFCPSDIFDCGQSFRFKPIGELYYEGVAFGRYIRVKKHGSDIILENTNLPELNSVWHDFFDLGRDYSQIICGFSGDSVLSGAIDFCPGMRIIKQEPFETLISYIISQNNNIPRIMGIIARLCESLGSAVIHNGKVYHSFPTPAAIARAGEEGLAPLRAGFRAKYILNAAKAVDSGIIDLAAVYNMDIHQGSRYLQQLQGVGPKVSACVLLFAYNKLDAFPIDVWVRRLLDKYYPGLKDPAGHFGEYAGIAGEYLFFYERRVGNSIENTKSAKA